MKKYVNGAAPPFVLASPGAGRSEAERSESERSSAPGEAKTTPDPEVVVRARRRQYTADYKKRILAEADSAKELGTVGALLRREGLYSSHLTHWRQQRDLGLAPHRRGPKPKHDPLSEEVRKLNRRNDLASINSIGATVSAADLVSTSAKRAGVFCFRSRWRHP